MKLERELEDLKRAWSKARLLGFAESRGLASRAGKIGCPDPGCVGHEKHDSCSLTDGDKGVLWHCHRAEHGGSIIDFVKAAEHCDTAEAIAKLREYDGQFREPPRRPMEAP